MKGKIDQYGQCFIVNEVIVGRDTCTTSQEITQLINTLTQWNKTCLDMIGVYNDNTNELKSNYTVQKLEINQIRKLQEYVYMYMV